MDLYKQYLLEREDSHLIYDDKGFVVYKYCDDKIAYIVEIFVKKDFRKKGIASMYANKVVEIVKKKGYNKLLGSVSPLANGSESSEKVLIAYGMKYTKTRDGLKWFFKEI